VQWPLARRSRVLDTPLAQASLGAQADALGEGPHHPPEQCIGLPAVGAIVVESTGNRVFEVPHGGCVAAAPMWLARTVIPIPR